MQVPPGRSLLAGGTNWPLWLAVLAIIAGVTALASIWLGRHHSRSAKIVWTVIVLVLPIVGPLAWFLLGFERRSPGS